MTVNPKLGRVTIAFDFIQHPWRLALDLQLRETSQGIKLGAKGQNAEMVAFLAQKHLQFLGSSVSWVIKAKIIMMMSNMPHRSCAACCAVLGSCESEFG